MDVERKNKLKTKIIEAFDHILVKNGENSQQNFASQKEDSSIVTLLDIEISKIVHDIFPDFKIYCEETYDQWKSEEFTLEQCIVLDPIDGTSSLANKSKECVVSFAMIDDGKKYGWLFNPFTGFEISSDSHFLKEDYQAKKFKTGLISRTELEKKKLFKEEELRTDLYQLQPMSSIAFKMGLMAAGSCDFVYSKEAKNIWDIAAGTFLLWDRGYTLLQSNKEILELDAVRYEGPLLWCHPQDAEKLLSKLK